MSLVTGLIDVSKFIFKQLEDYPNFLYYFARAFVRDFPIITTILLSILIIILLCKVRKYYQKRKNNLENIRWMNEQAKFELEQINIELENNRINQQFIYTFQDYLELDAEINFYIYYNFQHSIQNHSWNINQPYLYRFKYIWSVYRKINHHKRRYSTFHASYLDAHILKAIIPAEELDKFVSVMYSHALLLQVVYGMTFAENFNSTAYIDSEEKENMFPRVNGILSTINRHVCPAILPTMLLYITVGKMKKDNYLHYYSEQNLDLEKNIWKNKRKIFDDGINDAIKNLTFLLEIMLGCQYDVEKEVEDELLKEHNKLASAILNGDTNLRVMNR